MGFKGSTSLGSRFLCRFLLPVAFFALLLLLGSLWLPEGSPQACESSWRPCLSVYSPELQHIPPAVAGEKDSDRDGVHRDRIYRDRVHRDSIHRDGLLLSECPGQRFQVSQLLFHLHSALGPGSDVLLQPYLSSWDELIKFMESLGPVVEFFSQKVKSKVSLLRELARQDWEGRAETEEERGEAGGPAGALRVRALHDAVGAGAGVVDFRRQTGSGCRTLLRLHRALLWLQLFLRGMGEGPGAGRPRNPSELCREAYERALAPHHPWLLRRAAELAFLAMPEWDTFFRLVCVQSHQEAGPVLDRVVRAIEEVYSRTQGALEEHSMLELP